MPTKVSPRYASGHDLEGVALERRQQAVGLVALDRERVGHPEHVGTDATGALLGGDARVELTGGCAEDLDLQARD